MLRRTLGRTGIEVSVLGLGTVKLGRAEGVKYPRAFTIPTDEEAGALVRAALDSGINLFDTAPAYGGSEERLGRLLRGMRGRVVLSSKVGETFDQGRSEFDFSPRAIAASVERSLARLATDCIDILLVHSDGAVELDEAAMDAAMGELERIKRAGMARAVGASTKTVAGARRLVGRCDCLMVTLNPSSVDDRPVIEAAARVGTGVLVKKALASGHAALAGGPDPAGAALSFAVNTPGVTSVIVGTISPDHLRANVRAVDSGVARD